MRGVQTNNSEKIAQFDDGVTSRLIAFGRRFGPQKIAGQIS